MKEFMIVPPSTPSGATTPSESPYTATLTLEEQLEDQFILSEEGLKDYLASLPLEELQSLLSFLRAITAKKPSSPTKKKAPDANQLSFDDIG